MLYVLKGIVGLLILLPFSLCTSSVRRIDNTRLDQVLSSGTIIFENEQISNQRFPCQLRDTDIGICTELQECPQLSVLLKNPTQSNLKILQQALCGYTKRSPKVCCLSPDRVAAIGLNPSTLPVQVSQSNVNSFQKPGLKPPLNLPPPTQKVPPPQSVVVPSQQAGVKLPSSLPRECGVQQVLATRIAGGKEATPGAWPWLAALTYRLPDGARTFGCAGAVITSRHVLTAAHCLPDIEGVVLHSVRLGAHNLAHLGLGGNLGPERFPENITQFVDIPIERAIAHPGYVKKRKSKNDLAILKLARPTSFTSHIQPICIPLDDNVSNRELIGETTFVAGWGASSFQVKIPSPFLQQANFPVVSSSVCKSSYDQINSNIVIDETVLCAGDGVGKSDSCQGDSGGPLMYEVNKVFYAIGIVSSGHKCAEPGFYGVYMKTSHYKEWILNNIE